MKKLIIIMALTAFMSYLSSGQDFNKEMEAFTRSYSYEKEGKYTEAVKEIRNVYDENSYEANIRMGWLTYNAGSYLESVSYYEKAINLKPFALEPRFGIISPASATGNWTLVETQYTKILSVDPMNTKANYWTGMIFYNREQYDLAVKYFEKVANLYPFDYDSTIMYAWTNFKLNNLREAKVLFQKALLIRPGDESALQGLGLIQ
jgi:tetratricopeptide (TPR) repeat protein